MTLTILRGRSRGKYRWGNAAAVGPRSVREGGSFLSLMLRAATRLFLRVRLLLLHRVAALARAVDGEMVALVRLEGGVAFRIALTAHALEVEFRRPAALMRDCVVRIEREGFAVHRVMDGAVGLVCDLENDRLGLGPGEILDGVLTARLLAPRDADADLREVGVEQVFAMFGRVPPARHQGAAEFLRREAGRVVFPGDVLGDEAKLVALRADALRGLLAVGGVTEGVRPREIVGETCADRDRRLLFARAGRLWRARN